MNRTILTISALDCSGGDGIACDLKTFQTFRVYGTAAVTAVISQNTTGVQAIFPIPMEFVGQQIEAVVSDMQIHGVKVGALATASNVEIVATLIQAFNLKQYLFLDPMLNSSQGQQLLEPKALAPYKEKLLPLAFCITLNRQEAEVMTGRQVNDRTSAKDAAKVLFDAGVRNVVITGGHFEGPHSIDLHYDGNVYNAFDALRVHSNNTLGIGGTFSAILCSLCSRGVLLGEAIDKAKKYIAKAMQHPFQIGKGHGPLNHTLPM